MYSIIVALPLVGSTMAGLLGFLFGTAGSGAISVIMLFAAAFLSLLAFSEVGLGGSLVTYKYFPWIISGEFDVTWGFLFDSLTVTMLVVVTSVSSMVHLYSLEYMAHDPHRPRFIAYLSRFTFFMLVLVSGDNLLQLFLGWEGIGLSSYLLINFWFTRLQANKAALKAMLVNRVGDIGLALGILLLFVEFGTRNYGTIFNVGYLWSDTPFYFLGISFESLNLLGFFLLVGTAGKSAQLGLHTWLPDAMEGPTPVSALIHAATLVTAGVFLLARSSPILEYSSVILILITIVGSMTALFAASTGLLQNDMKRVIAYSTCSQLGYMVFACGLSAYGVGVFHLANHAFFKALLFLSAGSVIHALSDEQDLRRMGGLVKLLPLSYSMIFIGSLALMGFPYLTGFYSKDVILEVAYGSYNIPGHFAYVLGSLAAFFTAFYSVRLLYLVFLSEPNGHKKVISGVHDAPFKIAFPLVMLSFGAVFLGYLSRDLMIGLGTPFWENAIYTHPKNLLALDGEFLPHLPKVFPTMLAITGAISAYILYGYNSSLIYYLKISSVGNILYRMLNRKWMWDKVINENIIQPSLSVGYFITYLIVDRGVIEKLGPLGITIKITDLSSTISWRDTGTITSIIQRTIESILVFSMLALIGLSITMCIIGAIIYLLVVMFVL